jgi:hypothetical protein
MTNTALPGSGGHGQKSPYLSAALITKGGARQVIGMAMGADRN